MVRRLFRAEDEGEVRGAGEGGGAVESVADRRVVSRRFRMRKTPEKL